MFKKRYTLTFSFEKKSSQIDGSGSVDKVKQVGLDKGVKVTMYVALITLVAAFLNFGTQILKFIMW